MYAGREDGGIRNMRLQVELDIGRRRPKRAGGETGPMREEGVAWKGTCGRSGLNKKADTYGGRVYKRPFLQNSKHEEDREGSRMDFWRLNMLFAGLYRSQRGRAGDGTRCVYEEKK